MSRPPARRPPRPRSGSERGAITALAAVLLLAIMVTLALLVEVGSAVAAHRELLDTADAAARAGATALNLDLYRASNGQTAQLDPQDARQTAVQFVRVNRHSGTVHVQATTATVTVRLAQSHPPLIFTFVPSVRLTASATAAPQTGIREPEP